MAINDDKKNIVKLAYLYFQEGRWDKAIEEYQKLLKLDPEDINTHNMLGDVYVRKGSPAQAHEAYVKVLTEYTARAQTDKIALIKKKIAALDSTVLSSHAQQHQSLIRQNIAAEKAMEQGNLEEAIDAFNEVLKLDRDNLDIYAKLGELYGKVGRIPEAVVQYQFLGNHYLKNHLFKKALEMLKKVVELDPRNTDARINLAQIYLKQGSENDAKKEFLNIADQALLDEDLEKAFTYANKAVELKSIEAHYILGVVYVRQKKWEDAKNELDSLLRFKVNHVGALVHLGNVFNELGQPDKAGEQFQKALKIDKEYAPALEAWLEFSIKKGNKNEALSALKTLSDKAVSANDLDKALVFARQMVSLDPSNVSSQVKLAETLQKSGDDSSAADAFFRVVLLHEKNKKAELAEEFLRKTLEANIDHVEARAKAAPEMIEEIAAKMPPARKAASVPEKEAIAETSLSAPQEPASAPEMNLAVHTRVSEEEELKAQTDIADHYAKQGMLDEAIEIYQQLIEEHPDKPELKAKLNKVYTAYAKTGTDLTEAMNSAQAEVAEKKAETELDKVSQDMAKKAEESTKQLVKEMDAKSKEEGEKKIRMELEKKAREEAEIQAEEELRRLVAERQLKKSQEDKASKDVPPAKATPIKVEAPVARESEEALAMAEGESYQREGHYEKAVHVYRRIVEKDPHNLEAKRRLEDVEILMKAHGEKKLEALKQVAPARDEPGKDSDSKKRSSRIGYV